MINFSFSGCFGKDTLNFPFVLLERIISEGKISSGRMDQVPFPGTPSLPRGPTSAPSQRTSPRLAPGAPPGTGAGQQLQHMLCLGSLERPLATKKFLH